MSGLAEYLSAVYAFGGLGAGEREFQKEGIENTLEGQLSCLYWFNYYSDDLLEDCVRDQILSAPADWCETTSSESIILVPHTNPIADREKRGAVRDHLGL